MQPTEPQRDTPDQLPETAAQPTAQWITIYESGTVTASVLLRDGYVTRLLVKTPETLPLSFANDTLRRWNTDPRRHFKLSEEEWVLTDKEGTQPQYFMTVETTFKELEWAVIDTEPGITISVVEDESKVTRIRLDWGPKADLELEEAGTVSFANTALHNWNPVRGRQFQLDEEGWQQTEDGTNLQFETTVQTTFQTVLELYIETTESSNQEHLVQTVVRLLGQQLPQHSVDYTSVFGSVQRGEQSPYAQVTRTYVDNGEYHTETEHNWSVRPPYKVPIPPETIEPMLQAFENSLATNAVGTRHWHQNLLELRKVYRAIAQEQGIDLATVNSRRSHVTWGPFLPTAYVEGTPDAPDDVLETTNENAVPHEPLDLDTTIELLVEQLLQFEDADFSASQEGVTRQWAENLAAYLIQSLLRPGRVFDGKLLKEGLKETINYYEHLHDQMVAEQEVEASETWEPDPQTFDQV